jgi:hypothetical protein
MGRFLRELREMNEPLAEATTLPKEAELRASMAWNIVEILGARIDKIPDRQRPHYTPAQRFRILEIKSLLGWNRELIARLFRVYANTISNWEQDADPDSKTVGSTVKSIPPITRFADVGRNLVQTMLRLKFGGEDLFATARLERFWRTLKHTASLRLQPPLTICDLERRLEVTLTHYLCFRAHQGSEA